MRRINIGPELMGLGEIGVVGCGGRDAIECRREIVAAAAKDFGIGGGIAALPNAIHAFGIVSYK